MTKNCKEERLLLKEIIEDEVYVPRAKKSALFRTGTEYQWLFDFKSVMGRGDFLDAVATLFLSTFDTEDFQVGGLEFSAVPLVSAIVLKAKLSSRDINAFYIRKSRKKDGLMNLIEGKILDKPIILIDDILNSGDSILKQVGILEKEGKTIQSVFSILSFRKVDFYHKLFGGTVAVQSIFNLSDFKTTLGVDFIEDPIESLSERKSFSVQWYFKGTKPNYHYVLPKSGPVSDRESLYFGTDSGNFLSLDQKKGSINWDFKVVLGARGKYIFSSAIVEKDLVYFGAYDGNFYALEKNSGKRKWIFMEADWIGSSPVYGKKHNHVYVGLEFGLFKKKGALVALDANSGEKKWERYVEGYMHGSPAYSSMHDLVVCGSNSFDINAYKGSNGDCVWSYITGGEIRGGVTVNEKLKLATFGSFDNKFYALDLATGEPIFSFATLAPIYSTPVFVGEYVIFGSLDKSIYCFNALTWEKVWQYETGGRVFASPLAIDDVVYIGSNDGVLYGFDIHTGVIKARFQATERITNKIAYNPSTKNLFLPTFANEIYSLKFVE